MVSKPKAHGHSVCFLSSFIACLIANSCLGCQLSLPASLPSHPRKWQLTSKLPPSQWLSHWIEFAYCHWLRLCQLPMAPIIDIGMSPLPQASMCVGIWLVALMTDASMPSSMTFKNSIHSCSPTRASEAQTNRHINQLLGATFCRHPNITECQTELVQL